MILSLCSCDWGLDLLHIEIKVVPFDVYEELGIVALKLLPAGLSNHLARACALDPINLPNSSIKATFEATEA